MAGLIARRLAVAIPLAWAAATLVFLIFEALPGRPFAVEPGAGVDPESSAVLRGAFGTDRPAFERYLGWMTGLVTGDLGLSYSMRRPVAGVVLEAARNTFWLMGVALVLEFALGMGTGLVCARAGGWIDRAVTAGSSCLYSMPSYWLGLMLTWVAAVRLGWLPASQMRSVDADSLGAAGRLADALRHIALPSLALGLPAAAGVALYARELLRETRGREFVRAARARGLTEGRLILRHVLSNALNPVIALLGLALPGLIGGSLVVEVLFAWPGMGRLAYQAVLARDQPLILGCACAASVFVVLGGLAADLLAAALDPRVREALP